jgi:tRNA(Arg) A34 adenosine deaminase TadA
MRFDELSNRDQERIKLAQRLASMSESNTRTRHGCIIVKAGNVIAAGVNQYRNNPNLFDFTLDNTDCISVHAEEACLKALSYQARHCTAYIARLNSADMTAMSRPCDRCMRQLKDAGIDKLVYTTYTGVEIERI